MKFGIMIKSVAIISLALLFFLLSIGMFSNKENSIENRKLLSWNKFDIRTQSLGDAFHFVSRIFEDNFIFRAELIKVANFLDLNVFQTSPMGGGFVTGKNGWEFYTGDNNLVDQIGFMKLSGLQLARVAQNVQNSLQLLEQNGITGSIFVVPNKSSIYGEYLPDKFKARSAITRAQQISDMLDTKPKFKNLIFNKELFLSQKFSYPYHLYEMKGSHWNDLGAFVGYTKLLNVLGLKPVTIDEFRILEQPDYVAMSSTYMPTLNNFKYLNSPILLKKSPYNSFIEAVSTPTKLGFEISGVGPHQPFSVIIFKISNSDKPSLLIFGDSFATKLMSYLRFHFSKIIFVGSRFIDHEFVEQQKPDFVIHEISERFFTSVYLNLNHTITNATYPNKIINDLDYFEKSFHLKFHDGRFVSNIDKSVLVKSLNKKSLDFQNSRFGNGLIKSSLPQRGQIVLDFADKNIEELKISLTGIWKDIPNSNSKVEGSNEAILSVFLNGFEAKVSFNENGIFVGGPKTNISIGKLDLSEISNISLILKNKKASLSFDETKKFTWKAVPSNATGQGLIFGDFSINSSPKFSFELKSLELTTEL